MKYRLYESDSRSASEPDYPDVELYLIYDSAREAVEAKARQVNGKIVVLKRDKRKLEIQIIFEDCLALYAPFLIELPRFDKIRDTLFEDWIKKDLRIFPHTEESEEKGEEELINLDETIISSTDATELLSYPHLDHDHWYDEGESGHFVTTKENYKIAMEIKNHIDKCRELEERLKNYIFQEKEKDRDRMTLFIWTSLDKREQDEEEFEHPQSGLVIIAKSLKRARELGNPYFKVSEYEQADYVYELHRSEDKERIVMFPDSSCVAVNLFVNLFMNQKRRKNK